MLTESTNKPLTSASECAILCLQSQQIVTIDTKNEVEQMNEQEKKDIRMMEKANESYPKLTDEQKGFLLGCMEGISQMTETKKKRKRKVSE